MHEPDGAIYTNQGELYQYRAAQPRLKDNLTKWTSTKSRDKVAKSTTWCQLTIHAGKPDFGKEATNSTWGKSSGNKYPGREASISLMYFACAQLFERLLCALARSAATGIGSLR